MKSPVIQQIVIYLMVPLLFLSCAKDEQVIESEIVFHVPVYKANGSIDVFDVQVFPNPFWYNVNIYNNLHEGDSFDIQLSDESGNFSMKATVANGAYMFETEHMPEGVYYIEIKKDGYVDRAKMIKLKRD